MDEVCLGGDVVTLPPILTAAPYTGPQPTKEHDRVAIVWSVISIEGEETEDGSED